MFLKRISKMIGCLPYSKILCSFRYSGILVDNGWWQSFEQKLPVDKQNNPLPWVTYSFIDYNTPRNKTYLKI